MREKIEKLRPLVEQFLAHIKQYKSAGYDEANVRVDFIDKFFEILDWDVRNTQGFSEDYREVVREDKVIIAGKPKAPDYSFRIGGRRRFFVEAKKPIIYIKEEIDPAYQVRRYGYTAKLPLSILTDFEEFAVYDTRIKPSKKDKASVGRLYYCYFDDYEKNFEFIYNTFSKNAVLKGGFDEYIKENKGKKGTSEVDREFLELISEWREKLAKNIAVNNPKTDITLVNTAVQKIIDRIIFLRIAEDRGTEPYENLRKTGGLKKVYSALTALFEKAREKYNGDVFKTDETVDRLSIDNETLAGMLEEMYYPDCPYEFSVFPIEVLGNIYEQFLGKTIRLTEGHHAKVEEKPEVRKAGGVYYTPQYIVNYIVENTVGAKIHKADPSVVRQNKEAMDSGSGDALTDGSRVYRSPHDSTIEGTDGMTPAEISKLKILDPACGSGSFLIGAYTYLLDYHLKYYTDEKNLAKAVKEEKIFRIDEHHYHLTIKEKQAILLNNFYGVDIDPQAVEVTKLSLLLKLMENETKESEGKLFRHSDEKYLPNLSNNIKCGNSLIGSDFYDDKDMGLFGKDEIRKVNTFDWEKEFPGVFHHQDAKDTKETDLPRAELTESHVEPLRGGFDVVIGNPPYGAEIGLNEMQYLKLKYKAVDKEIDTYALFIEKGVNLCKSNGLLSMIVSTGWYSGVKYSLLRRYFAQTTDPLVFVNLPYDIFDAWIDTTVFVTVKRSRMDNWPRKDKCDVNICTFPKRHSITSEFEFYEKYQKVDFNEWFANESDEFLTYSDSKTTGIVLKIKTNGLPFMEFADIQRGVTPFDVSNKPSYSSSRLAFTGSVRRYSIQKGDKSYIRYDNTLAEFKPERYFVGPRILLREMISRKFRLQAVLVKDDFVTNKSMQSILANKGVDLRYLLGILNSKLISWYFLKISQIAQRDDFPKIVLKETRKLPIVLQKKGLKEVDITADRLISLVDQMLETQKLLHDAKTDHDRETYQKKADLIDGQIDRLVYELYGLTEEEIKIVEEASK